MKRRIALMMILAIIVALISSCKVSGGDKNKDNSNDSQSPGDTSGDNGNGDSADSGGPAGIVYSPDVDVAIIADPSLDYSYVDGIITALYELTGRMPKLVPSNTEQTEHLIVIGRVDHEISKAAYERIERYHLDIPEEDYEDYPRYLIYSDSTSVAIAYEEDDYDLALDAALKYFTSNYLKSSTLSMQKGIYHKNFCDLLAHIKKDDEERKAEQWEALRQNVLVKAAPLGAAEAEALADEFISAMKRLYSIYNPDMVLWFANLYEPYFCVCEGECQKTKHCGGGGFNHGRFV